MRLGKLIPVWLVLALLALCSVTSLAQETPEEAKRRAAIEAEIRAEAEKRKAIEDELRRKEAQGKTGADSDWDALNATINGQVVDARGQAVAGAAIFASWDDAKCANDTPARIQNQERGTTAEDGSFGVGFQVKLLKSVTSLEVSFYATHDDHLPGDAQTFTLTRGGQVDDVQLALAAAGSISGRVTDSNGGALGYARVVATMHIRPTEKKALLITRKARTDAAGNYTVKGLPTDKYVVSIECAGYKATELADPTAVKAGETKQVDVTLAIATAIRGKIDIRQVPEHAIGSCHIYEGETSVTVCGIVVHDDKTFTIIDPPVGTWEIEITWWKYRTVRRTSVTVVEGQHADIGAVETEEIYEDLPND